MDVAFTTPSVPPLPGHTMLEREAGAGWQTLYQDKA